MNEQLISSLTPQDQAGIAAVFGALAGMGIAFTIICLVIGILTIVPMWKIFTKAGEKGWKSIIPIYNTYILCKIAGRNFWKIFGITVALYILPLIIGAVGSGVVATILGIVCFALSIWLIVEIVLVYHGLSKNFGHGAGFTVGLIFLNTIFVLILGFGSSQYIGNKAE